MLNSATQLAGLRTHVGVGEAYPYVVPFTAAQLVTPIPGLNIAPILPAGSVVNIAGHLYRTVRDLEAGSPGPQIGASAPLGQQAFKGPLNRFIGFPSALSTYPRQTVERRLNVRRLSGLAGPT